MKHTTTIEQIKKSALQLLGATLSDDINSASIQDLIEKDDTYAQYLMNMDESINRAVMRIVHENVLPTKTYKIEYAKDYQEGITVNGNAMVIDVNQVIGDLREIKNIVLMDNGHVWYTEDVDYGTLGDDILLKSLKDGQMYLITYSYIPERVSPYMTLSETAMAWRDEEFELGNTGEGAYNKNVLDVPDDLANIIPKFVFGELYAHDEPTVAMYQGINQFEAYLATYIPPNEKTYNQIKNIFKGFN